jgi:hypothetical protein
LKKNIGTFSHKKVYKEAQNTKNKLFIFKKYCILRRKIGNSLSAALQTMYGVYFNAKNKKCSE